ncbi:hypothetical protein WN943_006781 [Citrus x changshan-huyou]
MVSFHLTILLRIFYATLLKLLLKKNPILKNKLNFPRMDKSRLLNLIKSADTATMQGIKSMYGTGAALEPLDSAYLNPMVGVLV